MVNRFEPPCQEVQILCQEKNPGPFSGLCRLNARMSVVKPEFTVILDRLSAQASDIIAIHAMIMI